MSRVADTILPMTTDSFGADITTSLHEQSECYKSLTDRGIDPFAPAGPDADDLLDMGIIACQDCGVHVDVSESHSACTDGASSTCSDCHDAVCGDRNCRA